MFNLSIALEDSAKRFPEREAIITKTGRWTFFDLNAKANKIANSLIDHGLIRGDKVALSCLNIPEFPAIYYGILKAGGVVVPLSVLLKKDEISYHLKDSDARYYFCHAGTELLPMGQEGINGYNLVKKCENFILIGEGNDLELPDSGYSLADFTDNKHGSFESADTSADDTAVIIYTSGTTGKPKGAELSHSNLAWNADLCRHLFQFVESDVTLTVLPMFHIFGQTCLMNASIMHGIPSVVVPRFDPLLILEAIQLEGVSVFAGVPTMYWGLLNYSDESGIIDLDKIKSNLRLCISGGASLPVQVLKDFENKYGVPIYEGYGMSEGSPVVSFNHPGKERKAGSIGTPVWGVEVKIVNENDDPVPVGEKGQLLYRGHNVMKGYYKNPESSEEALKGGWMHSGDVAIKDEDNFIFIVDRTKDMILRGGLNVYPREVEEVMMEHEKISMVAIVGVPDEKMGEEVAAFIVLNKDSHAEEQEIIDWVKERVAAYKYPRLIQFVESLPMNATGKILKRELRVRG